MVNNILSDGDPSNTGVETRIKPLLGVGRSERDVGFPKKDGRNQETVERHSLIPTNMVRASKDDPPRIMDKPKHRLQTERYSSSVTSWPRISDYPLYCYYCTDTD